MRIHTILAINFLGVVLFSCNGKNNGSKNDFNLKIEGKSNSFHVNESITPTIENKKELPIDSVTYEIDGNKIALANGKINLTDLKLGKQTIKATIYSKGKTEQVQKEVTLLADKAPKIYTYKILNTYPHSTEAFTEGLEFHGDTLYESTGRRGASMLTKYNYKTGEVYKKLNLDPAYFGEGITIIGNNVYMLTWQSMKGFIFDIGSFEKKGTFNFNQSKEGWGLTHDDHCIYKSDGSEKIWSLNPKTLEEESYIQATDNNKIYVKINELEYVNDKIYANSWQRDGVMIINPKTGAIEGVVDFRSLKKELNQTLGDDDVLNGIAYNKNTNTFFVTGKNWSKLFEIEIVPR
ncbi:glutaminyl-peptide cyclotransferase [Zhouia sp. PK063]|uniref:glutaminyl-peptide cyclotransferase n=1 Tax=Zhouia sp. PK063 TaxID=3373602 RepID=UPI00379F5352